VPKLGWLLGFSAMASLGLPGLAGFWGEFPALLASWNPSEILSSQEELYRTLTVIAALGTVLAAAYLLWLYQRTAFGEPNPEFVAPAHSLSAAGNEEHAHHGAGADIHDVTLVEWIAWTPFLIAIVVFGVYPQLMFEVMDPAVTQLVGVIEAGVG